MLSVILILIFGLLSLFSATRVFSSGRIYVERSLLFNKQLIFIILGLGVMFSSRQIDYKNWIRLATPIYFVAVLLLILVLHPALGAAIGGARRWFWFAGVAFSPTPLAHLSVLLFLSRHLAATSQTSSDLYTFIRTYIQIHIVAGLIALQPDLSDAILLLLATTLIFYIAGFKLTYLLLIPGLTAYAVISFILGAEYRIRRILAYLDPERDPLSAGFQVIQGMIALGSGGLTGAGFGNGIQKHYYLPDVYSTTIFAIIGEELGFLGTSALLLCYLLVVVRGFLIGLRINDPQGSLLAFGISTWLACQVIVSTTSVTALLPLGGIVLPLISYGGSWLLLNLCSLGILLNISSHTDHYVDHLANLRSATTVLTVKVSIKTQLLRQRVEQIASVVEHHFVYVFLTAVAVFLTLIGSTIYLIDWLLGK